jgi:hypothetical protein
MPELLIGCGRSERKKVCHPDSPVEWTELHTLDINPDHQPDMVWDLEALPLPYYDNAFDEIHAYEVLEHTGAMGDYRFFFTQWAEFWRILKPGGLFCGSVPLATDKWAWGDPSHKRIVTKEQFVFLDQTEYERQVGSTSMSDFRYLYQADFDFIWHEERDGTLYFALSAVKPSRIKAKN